MLIGFRRKEVLKFPELKKMEMFTSKKKKISLEMNIYMYDGVFLSFTSALAYLIDCSLIIIYLLYFQFRGELFQKPLVLFCNNRILTGLSDKLIKHIRSYFTSMKAVKIKLPIQHDI